MSDLSIFACSKLHTSCSGDWKFSGSSEDVFSDPRCSVKCGAMKFST